MDPRVGPESRPKWPHKESVESAPTSPGLCLHFGAETNLLNFQFKLKSLNCFITELLVIKHGIHFSSRTK